MAVFGLLDKMRKSYSFEGPINKFLAEFDDVVGPAVKYSPDVFEFMMHEVLAGYVEPLMIQYYRFAYELGIFNDVYDLDESLPKLELFRKFAGIVVRFEEKAQISREKAAEIVVVIIRNCSSDAYSKLWAVRRTELLPRGRDTDLNEVVAEKERTVEHRNIQLRADNTDDIEMCLKAARECLDKSSDFYDPESAMYYAVRYAEKTGSPEAYSMIGDMYYYGEGTEQDYALAVENYQKAADKGDSNAELMMYRCHYYGNGIKKSKGYAGMYLLEASRHGSAEADYIIGMKYLTGEDGQLNIQTAENSFIKAAGRNYGKAVTRLGQMYARGDIKGVSKKLGRKYFEAAAALGDPEGMYEFGKLLLYGRKDERDPEKAEEYIRRAAEKGNADAALMLAVMYKEGNAVVKSFFLAKRWAVEAVVRGCPVEAQAFVQLTGLTRHGCRCVPDISAIPDSVGTKALGPCWTRIIADIICENAGIGDRKKNMEKAVRLYEAAVGMGSIKAACKLAGLYRYGKGVPQDCKKAEELYQKASGTMHEAMIALAEMYMEQYPGDEGYDKAEKSLKGYDPVFAKKPDSDINGYEAFALMLELGLCGMRKPAYDLAAVNCERALHRGGSSKYTALKRLEHFYTDIAGDLEKSFRYTLRGAQAGFADMQCAAGYLLYNGIGVKKDERAGYNWLFRASENGSIAADLKLNEISKKRNGKGDTE